MTRCGLRRLATALLVLCLSSGVRPATSAEEEIPRPDLSSAPAYEVADVVDIRTVVITMEGKTSPSG